MTFLQPALLLALPLAALPIIIHLVHLYRRRQVKWAAMMFLRAAQKMNQGLSRLRQILILALRALAVAAIIFVVTRPLAGGWLGLTGGAPDTVMVLLDRSASMEQLNPATGVSKRQAGLKKLARTIRDVVGARSRLVLVDSATGRAQTLEKPEALNDLPQTEATDTGADIPGLLGHALDYITTNKSGRTDVWLLSDLQRSDWDAASGRWETLRRAFATLPGVRFHLLTYPQPAPDDLAVRVDRVVRRETHDAAELRLDLRVTRRAAANPQPAEVSLRFVIDGAATTMKATMAENQLLIQGYAIPIDKGIKRGWGRVELPGDANPANNVFHFVFDEPAPFHSVIVSDDESVTEPLSAALSAGLDAGRPYRVTKLTPARAAEIPWEEAALIIWQAPIPKPDDPLARQLQEHVASGRAALFLPPENPDENEIFGLRWKRWETGGDEKAKAVEWWRNDSGLLANTRDGSALPVGTTEIFRACAIGGEGIPLARLNSQAVILMRSEQTQEGQAWFLGVLPGARDSSLARDGVVLFAILHRALEECAPVLGKAQQRLAAVNALGPDPSKWQPVEKERAAVISGSLPLHAGVVSAGDRLVALNRPPGEDAPETVSEPALNELFAGLDFRVITETLEDNRGLTNEIWRTFLMVMAAALVGEALLCLPARREKSGAGRTGARTL